MPGASPLGSDPRVAITLAYAGGWLSGALVWLVERDRPAVRCHALQSVLAFGILTLGWTLCWTLSFATLIVSATAFFVLQRVAQVVLAAAVVVWLVCLWQAVRGAPLQLPFVGRYAERLVTGARPN